MTGGFGAPNVPGMIQQKADRFTQGQKPNDWQVPHLNLQSQTQPLYPGGTGA